MEKDAPWIPNDMISIENNLEKMTKTQQEADDVRPLIAWMLESADWFPDNRHLSMRHHSWGIFEAEDKFGITMMIDGIEIPTRYLAEKYVKLVIGKIPSVVVWMKLIKGQFWMANAKNPDKVLLS